MVNLALKGCSLRKIGQLVKIHSTIQYIVNTFKYTRSIKHVLREPKRRIFSAREERYVVNKILKKF